MNNRNQMILLGIFLLTITAAYILFTQPINLGLDLQGGTRLVLEAKDTAKVKVNSETVRGVKAVIDNRINALGVTEPIIQTKGDRQIIVELPGIKNPERAIKVVGDTALLEFIEAEWAPGDEKTMTKEKIKEIYGEGARLSYVEEVRNGMPAGRTPIILKRTVLTGSDLAGAFPGVDQYGNPVVNIEFNSSGTNIFADATSRNVGKPIAILLDGKIISAPRVNEPIPSGKAQISGNFSIEEMQDLVIKLKAGALPVPVEIIENKVVGPTLGKDSIEKSKVAGLIGFAFIFFFMIGYYRLPGFLSTISLAIYMVLVLAIMAMFRATLTLPGIAGFLLSIGMAVDANVIIFERLKEELRAKKSLRSAVEISFKRAFNAILDSNVTTIIAAATLFFLGTGTIKGFAVTLIIGILVSMFTAIVITRVFMGLLVDSKAYSAESKVFHK